jgi:hypothetical protein
VEPTEGAVTSGSVVVLDLRNKDGGEFGVADEDLPIGPLGHQGEHHAGKASSTPDFTYGQIAAISQLGCHLIVRQPPAALPPVLESSLA